jgi:hypothetical protein
MGGWINQSQSLLAEKTGVDLNLHKSEKTPIIVTIYEATSVILSNICIAIKKSFP